MTSEQPSAPVTSTSSGSAVHQRSPARTALSALLTVSVYGFWWWYDLNRELRALGRPARPWRALGLVTLGWLLVAPAVMAGWFWLAVVLSLVPVVMCLVSVRETTGMVAAAQREAATRRVLSVPASLGLVAVALAGLVAWFATTAAAGLTGGMLLGVIWPLVAMGFIGYVQAAFNEAVGGPR